ncbi:hypothetical protein HMPREF9442_03185 [Paraprevotella xylaniphila YIT 11841]|uniref:Uncharacterized protein n=1 Tax=Paraprevotella xylaniphila YIT 11841 TaxID=762982 RepID=F3QY92_9BACT|nr:hypothetical protein HMPREF9442_03185 [Paraprevotella xylaniphila YIT 11841]
MPIDYNPQSHHRSLLISKPAASTRQASFSQTASFRHIPSARNMKRRFYLTSVKRT